jgi:hypothetical protein
MPAKKKLKNLPKKSVSSKKAEAVKGGATKTVPSRSEVKDSHDRY